MRTQVKLMGCNLWGQTFGGKPLGANLWGQTFGANLQGQTVGGKPSGANFRGQTFGQSLFDILQFYILTVILIFLIHIYLGSTKTITTPRNVKFGQNIFA
jgi:hypothetical protein